MSAFRAVITYLCRNLCSVKHRSSDVLFGLRRFDALQIPNVFGIVLYRTVGREYTGFGDIDKRHLVPLVNGTVRFVHARRRFEIVVEVQKAHIRVGDVVAAREQVVRDVGEALSVEAHSQSVDYALDLVVVRVYRRRAVTLAPNAVDVLRPYS